MWHFFPSLYRDTHFALRLFVDSFVCINRCVTKLIVVLGYFTHISESPNINSHFRYRIFFLVISFLLLRCFWFHRFGALQFTQQAQTRTNHSLTMILIEISTSLLRFFLSGSWLLFSYFFAVSTDYVWIKQWFIFLQLHFVYLDPMNHTNHMFVVHFGKHSAIIKSKTPYTLSLEQFACYFAVLFVSFFRYGR